MKNKEIYLIDDIDEKNIQKLMEEIQKESGSEEIILYICSVGGVSGAAFAFYDWIKLKNINLTTVGLGKVYSAAIILFLAGKKRKATPNTIFLIHGFYKKWKDVTFSSLELKSQAEESELSDRKIFDIIKKETKISEEELSKARYQDVLLTAEEALEKALIEEILNNK